MSADTLYSSRQIVSRDTVCLIGNLGIATCFIRIECLVLVIRTTKNKTMLVFWIRNPCRPTRLNEPNNAFHATRSGEPNSVFDRHADGRGRRHCSRTASTPSAFRAPSHLRPIDPRPRRSAHGATPPTRDRRASGFGDRTPDRQVFVQRRLLSFTRG